MIGLIVSELFLIRAHRTEAQQARFFQKTSLSGKWVDQILLLDEIGSGLLSESFYIFSSLMISLILKWI